MLALLAVAVLASPPASPGAVVDSIHGYEIADPYRWLENADAAKDWVTRENDRTLKYLNRLERKTVAARLLELSKIGFIGRVRVAGGRLFYVRRAGDAEQGVLFVRADGRDRILVDPGTLDKTGKTSLDWYTPSRTGRLVAYGLSRGGDEDSTLHVLDVDAGALRPERIANTRHASIAWRSDDGGFFYTRFPPGDRYHRRVFFHTLGADPDEDAPVFGEGRDKTDWPDVAMSDDGKTVAVVVYRGFSKSDVYLVDVAGRAARPVVEGKDALFDDVALVDGKLYLRTNLGAPRWKVVAADPTAPSADRWTTVVPEGEWPIDGLVMAGGRAVVRTIEKAVSRLRVYEPGGQFERDVDLPGIGSVRSLDGEWSRPEAAFDFTSFFDPGAVYTVNLGERAPPVAAARLSAPFDASAYTAAQVDYPSYDGTKVPMFILHRKDAPSDGSNAVLLTGYGGFNISLTPSFSSVAVFWLERGGVYAVANLRGGGERGETWHEAGKKAAKHQVFADFEYAMRHLVRAGYTTPPKLAITGGSNGGLLVGAMMTRAPYLFRAAVGKVGLYDMVRYQRFPPAELWVDEYGSSDTAAEAGYLYGYSPYHQAMRGVSYPAFLGLTAESDTRVHWLHTAKFVAALQAATAAKAPILFFLERQVGHGAGKGRTDAVEDAVKTMQFLLAHVEPRRPAK